MGTTVSPTPVAPLLYELQPTRPLPRIDNSKCVKHAILSQRAHRLFNRFTAATGKFLGLSFLMGMALCAASLVTLSPIAGVHLAVVSSPLLLVPTCVALLVLRFDMVALLVRTYEFWYMTLTNVVVCVLVSLSLADARWLVVFSVGVAFQLALLIDANFRATKAAVWATVLGAMLNMGYVFSSMFGYLRNLTELTLFHYKQRILLGDDALMNVLGTLCVLMVRNAYRKRRQYTRSTAKRATNTERVTCIMYRCRLALRHVSAATAPEDRKSSIAIPSAVNIGPFPASVAPSRQTTHSNAIPLQFARDHQYYSAADICFPRVVRCLPASVCWQLHAATVVSLASVFVALLSLNASLVLTAAVVSVCGAATVFVVYVSFAQRELLARQLSSFDFLSVQLSIIHICLADIVGWPNPRVLVVLSSWLWTHWVLLVDTVLPIHKTTRLGYRPCVAVFVLLLFIVQQVAVFIAIVFYGESKDPRLALRDRELFVISLHGRVRQVRVVPVLFGRMVTALSWSLRLLWRLFPNGTVKEDELLLMQGRVYFDNPVGRPRESKVPGS